MKTEDVAGANECVSAPAPDEVTPARTDPLGRDSRAFHRYRETDADMHAEDVWHAKHDGESERP